MTKIANGNRRLVWPVLGLFGFLLAGQNARAAWNAVNVPEPEPVWPWATIPTGPSGVTLFGRGAGSGTLYWAQNSKGTWYFAPIYTSKDGPLSITASASYLQGLSQLLDIYYVAHIDSDMVNGVLEPKIRLSSFEFFNGWTTAVVDQTSSSLLATVATRVYGGKLYIFYSSPQGGVDTLKVAVYDGTKFVSQLIDGLGGLNGQIAGNMYMPTAVEADGLRVYYHDNDHGTLREAHSKDGMTWTDFAVVDGPGVAGDRDLVGWWPAAIVFNGTVNVFYTDFSNQWLRIAQRAGGTWTYGWIEPVDVQTYKAPVVHGNEMQVYYESGGKLRVAFGTGPGLLSLATLDGGPGYGPPPPGIAGAVSDPMGFYATAVETNGVAPSVFYWDTQSDKLRNVYWK